MIVTALHLNVELPMGNHAFAPSCLAGTRWRRPRPL